MPTKMVRLVVPTTPPQQQQQHQQSMVVGPGDSPNGPGQISPASCPSPVSDCTSVVSSLSGGGGSTTPSNGGASPAPTAATKATPGVPLSAAQPQTAIVQPQVQQLPPPPPPQLLPPPFHHPAQLQAVQMAQQHPHMVHHHNGQMAPPPAPPQPQTAGGPAADCNGHLMNGGNNAGNGGAAPAGGQIYIPSYTCEYYGEHNYYYAPAQELCPAHQPMCIQDYGPVTVPMVSQNGSPPIPMPVQVPPGHVMQQVVDENGHLRHVILSSAQTHQIHQPGGVQHHLHPHYVNYPTNGSAPAQYYSAIPTTAYSGPLPGQAPPQPFNTMAPVAGGGGPGGGGGGGGGGGTTYTLVPQTQIHSPSPPNGNNTNNSGSNPSPGSNQALYHNKDERMQQMYKKLRTKLDKRSENTSTNGGASPRKNGEMIMQSTIPVNMVVGNKRVNNTNSSSSSNTNNGGHKTQPQQVNYHIQFHHPPQQQHMNSHSRVLPVNNNTGATTGGRKVVLSKGKNKKLNGSATNGNGAASEEGEEGTSSVPEEDEEGGYQLEVEDEVDGEVVMPANGTPAAPGELSSAEEEVQHIKEQLSLVAAPTVSEILSRSALLQWVAPPSSETVPLDAQGLFYEILLSDSAKAAKYKSIFKGQSLSCRIEDLKPGIEYSVCLRVHYQNVQGLESPTTIFNTVPCAPDAPMPPKLLSRSKNQLQLRWNGTNDNGAHIQQYVLEYDLGRGMDFVEVCRTKGKHYTLAKLMPSTNYRFRLYAINEYGKSDYSRIESFQTACLPPTQPSQPSMPYATSSSLRLEWVRRPSDREFTLQWAALNDNGHGYLPCYIGPDTSYECTNLPRATGFLFRLKAANESGPSPWSQDVIYYTLPDPPGRPAKPQVKGKIHATHFRIKWDPPADFGGAHIKQYELQYSSGTAYERAYVGPDTETQFVNLSPATTYQVRVLAEGPGGYSPFSEPCTVTTEPVTPCAPQRPQLYDLGVYSASIRWGAPSDNGGSPVLEYEVELEGRLMAGGSGNGTKSVVYRGKDMCCDLKQLLPGEQYRVQVRAYNRIGAGAWSEEFSFSANAAPPNTPRPPRVTVKTPTQLLVEWEEPHSNGAPVDKYVLEMEHKREGVQEEEGHHFEVVYSGSGLSYEVGNLQPYSLFLFRLCAVNAAGQSNYSEVVQTRTPPGVPAVPSIHELLVTEDSVTVYFKEPPTNGAEVVEYHLEYASSSSNSKCQGSSSPQAATTKKLTLQGLTPNAEGNLEYTVEGLSAETTYRLKLRAVNAVGCSQYSQTSKVTTLPHPPAPPAIECVGVGHNSLKLKWGEGKNVDFLYYYVDMSHSRSREYANVYQGSSFTCKVNKLAERTTYKFRIRAKADRAGMGPYSEDYLFQTSAALPQVIKAPRVYYPSVAVGAQEEEGKTTQAVDLRVNNVNVEWQHSKNQFQDPVEYILQVKRNEAGHEFTQVYRGPETKHMVENLDCGVEYSMRVCPVRLMRKQQALAKGGGRNSRSSGGAGDSRSSSCSQSGTTAGGEDHQSKDCDIEELLGQWTPLLNYVVPSRADPPQSTVAVQQVPHLHCKCHHYHHQPHSHHRNNAGNASQSQPAAMVVGAAREGKSDAETVAVAASGGSVIGKLRSMYLSRHNMSDAEKAMIFAFCFMLVAIALSVCVNHYL